MNQLRIAEVTWLRHLHTVRLPLLPRYALLWPVARVAEACTSPLRVDNKPHGPPSNLFRRCIPHSAASIPPVSIANPFNPMAPSNSPQTLLWDMYGANVAVDDPLWLPACPDRPGWD